MQTQILLITLGLLAMLFFALLTTYRIWGAALLRSFADHNFFVTTVEEGYAKAIMHFGKFNRLALSWRNHYFDANWNVVEGAPTEADQDREHPMDRILPGGLKWIGLPFASGVYRYHFQWTSIRQGALGAGIATDRGLESIVQQQKLEDLLIARDERPDRILLKRDAYVINFQDINDSEMIPLSFIAVFMGRTTNPYLAYLKQEQWLEQTTNFLRGYIKEYVGSHTFEELSTTSGRNAHGAEEESSSILQLTAAHSGKSLADHIKEEWGFEIEQLNLVNFRTGGKRGEAYEASAAKKYQAQREAEAIGVLAEAESKKLATVAEGEGKKILILAKADGERIEIIAIADAKRIDTIAGVEAERITKVTNAITAGGDDARTLRVLEAYEDMGENGNTIVIGGDKPPQMLLNSTRPTKLIQAPGPIKEGGNK